MPDNYPTLLDVARRSGNASATEIVEVLNKTNQALDDIPWIECNGGVVHKTTTRTSIPTPVWRMLNGGVPVAKSTTIRKTGNHSAAHGLANFTVSKTS